MSRLTKNTFHLDNSKNNKKLWQDSPCTLSFTNKLPYLQQANRFEYNSIYYRDDPHKPARKIDEFQKPDLLLLEFRRNIREAQKTKIHNGLRNSSIRNSLNSSQNYSSASPKQKQIIQRLYPKNLKHLKLQYDLHGNRSSFVAEENEKSPKRQKKSLQILKKFDNLFTDSDRIDMSRPQNFNPGPGTYFSASITSFSKSIASREDSSMNKSQLKTLQHRKNSSTFHPHKSTQIKQRAPLINKTIIN